MNNELVSIIIPVYNAEKTIEKCLDSIINQTYKNIEIIMVNDGSGDNSEKVIESYKDNDSRIKYCYQENQGVSAARNLGISIARGEYVIFADADDYFEFNLVEQEVKCIKGVDCCFFEYYEDNLSGDYKKCNKEADYGIYNQESRIDLIKKMSGGGLYLSTIWRTIYRLRIIQDFKIKFKPIAFAEDSLFNLEYILNSKKIRVSEDAYYHYCEQKDSSIKKIQFEIDHTIEGTKENNKIFLQYRDSGLEDIYPSQINNSCIRILNMTLKYRLFKKTISQLEVIEDVREFAPNNRITNLLIKHNYFILYLLLWKKKISNKITRIYKY